MEKPVVLCIDDEKIILESLEEQLRRELGDICHFEVAESGEEALEIVQEYLKDRAELAVVISDQLMPNMKGDEVLIEIHRISPETHKILLTGQASVDSVGNAVNRARLYRYIAKPWEKTDLVLTVREAIKSFSKEKEIQEKNRLLLETNQAYERFVPRDFISLLQKESIIDLRHGDNMEMEMTILFSDIRSFTTIAESMEPFKTFKYLNAYLSEVGPIIRKNNGFIDKYIGDAVMALFPRKPGDAVQAAIEMKQMLSAHNDRIQEQGLPPLRIGVGIHTGPMILGIIGENERMEGTVIADAVNVASRLEELNKYFGTGILISQEVLNRLPPDSSSRLLMRYLDSIQMKGKDTEVSVYEVYGGDPADEASRKERTRELFEKGIDLYRNKKFSEAGECFIDVLKENPSDRPSIFYLQRVAHYTVYGSPLLSEKDEKHIIWQDAYNTGIIAIDTQHRILAGLINELHSAMRDGVEAEVLSRIFHNLNIYAVAHFSIEEELMLKYGFPGLEGHKLEHMAFRERVGAIMQGGESLQGSPGQQLLQYLKEWLLGHIQGSDRKYIPYIMEDRTELLSGYDYLKAEMVSSLRTPA